ncbi:RNA polymerase sigma factor for flagellar operon FliA [Chromobacterium alkanivorans]|uniref:RNA polymerase sigma factor FliA n=1 Tax=Chromobacterium TaxID=535 RepID=UPI00065293F3|nr:MULTISPECIES: RNA polymerase sigma factor FliA [Chromobacterium]KMN76706.1 flagellar biosynthesis sigma factor [Chromobacterium sp. LK11]MCS3804733.1 RNA polymerase sigma factor for flagellar operon FliA [Chromobacterium alkanivorans]MCS3819072.1 RNA polymerase sigma factor for flagellar operon FliA [Chromobacterium alkanivorans]MCS3873070.1 RNA polymerase sigma factor for flagellar operon FliA [Chromobacterium alkanivorans]
MYACYDEAPASAGGEAEALSRYAHLVKRVARQLSSQAGGVFDREDMEQVGLMALLESLRRYGEPDDKFAGFAILRIRGAILDELRRLDWRPRSVRQEAHRVRDGLRLLSRKLGREPSEAEAMQLLGLSAEAYQEALLADNAEALSSFDELMAQGLEPAADDNPEQRLALKSALTVALQALNPREQQVIQLYYEFELSLKEIAAVLALTEARVCQINKSALKKMQACLQAA